MPSLPSSGPISMSMINTVLSRASNTANSQLAGGSTPTVGSLFYIGNQSGSINQTAPHAISEWYGYTTEAPLAPPLMKYDPYSSSFTGTTVTNLGSAGTAYNMTAFGSIITGSIVGKTGGNYFRINDGLSGQYMSSSNGPNISGSNFSLSMMVNVKLNGSPIMMINSGSNNYVGIELTNALGEGLVYGIPTNVDGLLSVPVSGSLTNNSWTHIVYTSERIGSTITGKLYIDNSLVNTNAVTNPPFYLNATGIYRPIVGLDVPGSVLGLKTGSLQVGSISFWTGSILTSGQIGGLYNEFVSRYIFL